MTIPHPYDEAAWRKTIEDAQTVGQSFIVAASKSGGGNTEADWRAYAKTLNKAGKIARKEGFAHIGHHCHGGEWEPTEDNPDVTPVEIMMADTDPDLFHVQMDIGWCYTVTDPAQQMKKYPGRFWQVHVKDIRGGAPTFPGYGEIGAEGFKKVFAAAKESRQPITDYAMNKMRPLPASSPLRWAGTSCTAWSTATAARSSQNPATFPRSLAISKREREPPRPVFRRGAN